MRIILYDYETEKVRRKVRKALKKLGLHAQWSVFESLESKDKILKALIEEEGQNSRIAIFKVNPLGEIRKIGKEWERLMVVF